MLKQVFYRVILNDETVVADGLLFESDAVSRVDDYLKARGKAGQQREVIKDGDRVVAIRTNWLDFDIEEVSR